MDEIKQVFIHQLEVEGVIDVIRSDHKEIFAEPVVMNQAARAITENITSRLPHECAELLERALLEVYKILAPRLCPHFDLFSRVADTSERSLAFYETHEEMGTASSTV